MNNPIWVIITVASKPREKNTCIPVYTPFTLLLFGAFAVAATASLNSINVANLVMCS